jgi:hypothetical protein
MLNKRPFISAETKSYQLTSIEPPGAGALIIIEEETDGATSEKPRYSKLFEL